MNLRIPRRRTAAACRPYLSSGRAGSPSRPWLPATQRSAFTLVELLVVISVIGIIAAMVISSYSNAAQDSRRVVALQQQAEIQSAINNWIAAQDSVSGARTDYNAAGSAAQKLALVEDYLDGTTLAQFDADSNGAYDVDTSGFLVSDVMGRVSQSLELPDWAADSYPQVILHQ